MLDLYVTLNSCPTEGSKICFDKRLWKCLRYKFHENMSEELFNI